MFEEIRKLIIHHQQLTPLIVFISILLAGMNVPISLDLVLVLSAFLAATTINDHIITLYISLLLGSYFSAWIAYWIGRGFGKKLLTYPFFSRLLPEKKQLQMKQFYEKYGLWALLVGRFIPFGIRNCLFMSTGLSRFNFKKFIIRDALACFLWVTVMFTLFFHLSKNFDVLFSFLKKFQLCLFAGFSVTVIGAFWYKLKKKKSN